MSDPGTLATAAFAQGPEDGGKAAAYAEACRPDVTSIIEMWTGFFEIDTCAYELYYGVATINQHMCTYHVGRIVARQKENGFGNLHGISDSANGKVPLHRKLVHRLIRLFRVSFQHRGSHWAGADSIDANVLLRVF